VRIVQVAISLALTTGATGGALNAIDSQAVISETTGVAQAASCHTVAAAIVAYLAEHDTDPRSIGELRPYVDGDIAAYRLVGDEVHGPGCPAGA
jgi:hypothetical protein